MNQFAGPRASNLVVCPESVCNAKEVCTMNSKTRVLITTVIAAVAAPAADVNAKEEADIRIAYEARPTTELPRGLERVAVLDSETTDDAEKKWSQIAANMIAGLLDEAARQGSQRLTVVDRQNLKKVMAEKDLALSGIIDGARAAEASKILNVQGIIASAIKVKVEKRRGKRKTISGLNIDTFRRGFRGGGSPVETREVGTVSRHITVQCKFRLLDAMNAKVLVDHVSPILSKTDESKPRPFWGSTKTEAELEPRDRVIGELVEDEVQKFIGRFFPIKLTYTVHVKSSGNDDCEAGVRMMRVGEFDEAIRLFEKAIADDDDGDKHASFCMGAAYEAKGEYEKALKHYRVALLEDVDEAAEAVKRVNDRIDRLREQTRRSERE